jgi:hypothetical protein
MEKIIKYIPDIIGEAAKNTLGLLALMVIIISVIGFIFFRKSSDWIRVGMFILLFIGVVSFGAIALQTHITQSQNIPVPTDSSPVKNSVPQKLSNTEKTSPLARVETGVSAQQLKARPYTGAIVTLSDGSVIKLRNVFVSVARGYKLFKVSLLT